MVTAEESWRLLIIAAVVAGLNVGVTWLGFATLTGSGFTGVLGAILILILVLTIGIFATIGVFWLIFVILRVRDS